MSSNRTFTERLAGFGVTVWAIVVIASLILLGANFVAADYYADRENNARTVTADLQVLSQQLAKYTQEAVDGNAEAFTEFKATKARVDAIVAALRNGSTTMGVDAYEGDKRVYSRTWELSFPRDGV